MPELNWLGDRKCGIACCNRVARPPVENLKAIAMLESDDEVLLEDSLCPAS